MEDDILLRKADLAFLIMETARFLSRQYLREIELELEALANRWK